MGHFPVRYVTNYNKLPEGSLFASMGFKDFVKLETKNGSPQDGTQNMKAKNVTGHGTKRDESRQIGNQVENHGPKKKDRGNTA